MRSRAPGSRPLLDCGEPSLHASLLKNPMNNPALSCVTIVPFSGASDELAAIREIFFLSSSRTQFASAVEREDFLARWTDYYLDHCRKYIFLARHGASVVGYLTGCAQSFKALPFFKDRVKSYALFMDQFDRFPAHLHVNCHPDVRNIGIGRLLVERFEVALATTAPGVHVVTSPLSQNVHFYHRLGFTYAITRETEGGKQLLFLGKALGGIKER